MKLKYLAHACFLITSEAGLRIITDPYVAGGNIKYAPITDAADIITVSHDHSDHNAVSSVRGTPETFTGSGQKNIKGIQFKGIATYHDDSEGSQRGNNSVICFSLDGIRVCHLGDLGHRLSREQLNEIGEPDLLLIPVGGFYTIDAENATQICDELKPKIVVPMHYKTPKIDFPIASVDDFLKGKKNVNRPDSSETELRANELPDTTEIVVLKPAL